MDAKLTANANYGASLKRGKGPITPLTPVRFNVFQNFDHVPTIEEHRRILSDLIFKSERAEKELWSQIEDTNSYALIIQIYGKMYTEDSVEPHGYNQNIMTMPDFGSKGVRAAIEDRIKNFKPLKHNDYIGTHDDEELLFITKVIVKLYSSK